MFEHRRTRYLTTIRIFEFLVVFVFYSVAAVWTDTFAHIRTAPDSEFTWVILAVGFSLIGLYIIHTLYNSGIYLKKEYFYLPDLKTQILNYIVLLGLDAVFLLSIDIFIPGNIYSSGFLLVFVGMTAVCGSIIKWLTERVFSLIHNTRRNIRNVLIVGSNQRAVDFATFIERNSFLGFHVLGFVDDQAVAAPPSMIIGCRADFSSIISQDVVDSVVIHLPIRTFYDEIMEIIRLTEEQGISVHFLTNVFETAKSQMTSYQMGSISTLVMYTAPLEDWKMFLKRLFDIVFSAFILICVSPILLAAAIAIKLTSKGPVIYRQERVGYNKRHFKMYKLRSMVVEADVMQAQLESLNEMDGPVFKIKKDPRITKIGAILRKYSLDELPQFYNVLKGDMSVVGPRPLPLRDYNRFSEDWLRRRFSMRPGITCYWQIAGRNDLGFEEWIQLDMEYIDNWNLMEDFRIILKTIPAAIRGSGS